MLIDSKTGKFALKSHDLYQIVMCSLDSACKSYMNKDVKGIFPHKMINNLFFKDENILNKTFNLTKNDFYKRDHDKLKEANIINYCIKHLLFKCGRNGTIITLELYEALNEHVTNI